MPRTVTKRADVLPALAELFRERGYDGVSLSAITARTGLGKGSLYNFFPGGKAEMAAAVLDEIDCWFEARVFTPLRAGPEGIATMLDAVDTFFHSGGRVCLAGAFALAETRDTFAERVRPYFRRWLDALAAALVAAGHPPDRAADLAEEAIALIQGALVLGRGLEDPAVFSRRLAGLRARLTPPRAEHPLFK